MRFWPFGRKRESRADLVINRNLHLSVLAQRRSLPPLLSVVNPDGSNGAVQGFGAPLFEGATKDILNEPLRQGDYGIVTPRQDTVLQMTIVPLEEIPQFQKPSTETERRQSGVTEAMIPFLDAADVLLDTTIRGYKDALVSMRFFLDYVKRLGELAEGVVADPLAETYRMPTDLYVKDRLHPHVDFREIGATRVEALDDGLWVSSRGMAKFNLPELEMYGVATEDFDAAVRMIIAACQQVILGVPFRIGETAFLPSQPLQIVEGTRNRDIWGDRPTLEFRDPRGQGAAKGVAAWKAAHLSGQSDSTDLR
ncbi:MAG: hypothetical protein D6724_00165 [Armatimonadetes bacterium]|nr:MAG: hypothetical protein D6724_00165 [Armatimonadota bacterium]